MRAFVIVPAIAVLAIFPIVSAHAAVMTVGGPLSGDCYQAALAHDGRSAAMEACTRSLQEESLSDKDRAATLVNRGIVQMSAGRSDAADADFDRALLLNAALPDGWLNKGFLRLRQGRGQDALPFIQKGIDAGAGRQATAIFGRAVANEQIGNYRAAYEDLMLARKLDPRWSLPREYLASYQVRK